MIDKYIWTIKLWYAYLLKQRKQIFSKFKRQVICALNMKEKDTQRQTEPVFDLYRDSLEDVMDSNIDDRLLGENNYLRLSKPSTLILWPEKAVLLLSGLLGTGSRATSSKKNNLRLFLTDNSSSRLLPSIVPQNPLSLLLKPNNH